MRGRDRPASVPSPCQRPSEQPTLRERCTLAVADDEVVEHPDVNEGQGLRQAPGQELVRLAGLEHPARVHVGENHGRGVVAQSAPDDLPRINPRPVDRAGKEDLTRYDPVPIVEGYDGEILP